MTRALSEGFKAEAFRLGHVICFLSMPLGMVLMPAALMVSDAGDVRNPALVTFAFTAMVYPLVALVCGVVALVIRRRSQGARPWFCLVLPLVTIVVGLVAVTAI